MANPRVFVSFDFDNDLALKNLFVGQSKNPDSPFEIEDWSLKEEEEEEEWKAEARRRIKRSKYFVVLVGAKTYRAPGVRKEIRIAKEEGITRYQIKSADNDYSWVEDAGTRLTWTWENLKNYLV